MPEAIVLLRISIPAGSGIVPLAIIRFPEDCPVAASRGLLTPLPIGSVPEAMRPAPWPPPVPTVEGLEAPHE